MLTFRIEPNRVIEINNAKYYVLGRPEFSLLRVKDPLAPNKARDGYIIIDESIATSSNPYELNKLFRMGKNKLVPVLFKSREMAEEVVYACNRIRV